MKNSILQTTLEELNIHAFIQRANDATLARMIASIQTEDTDQPTPAKLPRFALAYEKQGIKIYKQFIVRQADVSRADIESCFGSAYTCWRTLALLPDEPLQAVNGHLSTQGIHFVEAEFHEELLSPALVLAFRLAVSGLLGGRIAETRLDLTRFSLPQQIESSNNWNHIVAEHIFTAFVLLVRKSKGWEDIQEAMQRVLALRQMQSAYEENYLEKLDDPQQQSNAALELAGLYNLAQLVTLVGDYLRTGESGYDKVIVRLDRHHEQAIEALEEGQHLLLAHVADLLWVGCRELLQNAIWTHVPRLGKRIQEYVQLLTSSARSQPVIELWPSQQEALRNHLLDTYQRAILVEMPTSAGKTLLAKFIVVQTKALNPEGLIAYVVPTRALVNQVTLDFRMDFGQMLKVEQTVPVMELDPTEEKLLRGKIDVLITTPEKLDLLVRSDHPIVKNITLLVADEAHNISDGQRGARLELLLGTIKRDFAEARFLLLSPFLKNAQEIVEWLGDDQALLPIHVDWKPNSKLVGSVQSVNHENTYPLEFETFRSIHSDIRAGIKITIGQTSFHLTTIKAITKATTQAMVKRGSVLVLCKGQATAIERATEIAHERVKNEGNEKLDAVNHYIEAELGKNSNLVECLRHGVAFHYSGLSQEVRWLIEDLIRDHLVDVVCATTTLAQGINFPITTVIIETFQKGRNEKLSHQDFWNIAGRAGRTLVDPLGVVVYPTPTVAKLEDQLKRREEFAKFLQSEAEEVVSQLIKLINTIDGLNNQFTLSSLRIHEGLSPLLQFLAHAMRVSGKVNLADEVEDLLRASLVYHQLQKHNQLAALKLIKLCRRYIEQTSQHKNILGLADQTGFATPSVLKLLSQKAHSQELTHEMNWSPGRLFGKNIEPLTERVSVIADIPEINLGRDEGGKFNAKNVAKILRDWVNGKTIEEMALSYGTRNEDRNKQIAVFSKYLFSILNLASWGIGALETVCLSGNERTNWSEVGYVPSMIYFGVPQKEAIWFRMVGVPRIVAGSLADIWKQQSKDEPGSYDSLREWIANLSDKDWQKAIPAQTSLTPQEMRVIWQSFSGGR